MGQTWQIFPQKLHFLTDNLLLNVVKVPEEVQAAKQSHQAFQVAVFTSFKFQLLLYQVTLSPGDSLGIATIFDSPLSHLLLKSFVLLDLGLVFDPFL